MTNLRQKVLAVGLVFFASACGFAQRNDNRRPPKDEPKVVVKDKDKNPKPPPSNNNSQGNKGKKN